MTEDLLAVVMLVLMEGLLSFDNAMALAAMVRPLPEALRKRALTYGIIGAFAFRAFALFFIAYLMQATWIKLAGGLYLCYVGISSLIKHDSEAAAKEISATAFWRVVLLVELTDIAFSIDSILAAVAVSPRLWVVVTGGVLGIIMMRFAATLFIRLIDLFPKLEASAFLLVTVVGVKLMLEAGQVWFGWHIGFESWEPGFVGFWAAMVASLAYGFSGGRSEKREIRKSSFGEVG